MEKYRNNPLIRKEHIPIILPAKMGRCSYYDGVSCCPKSFLRCFMMELLHGWYVPWSNSSEDYFHIDRLKCMYIFLSLGRFVLLSKLFLLWDNCVFMCKVWTEEVFFIAETRGFAVLVSDYSWNSLQCFLCRPPLMQYRIIFAHWIKVIIVLGLAGFVAGLLTWCAMQWISQLGDQENL